MAKIIAARLDCTGRGMEVWTAEDPTPMFFMGVTDPKAVDQKAVDAVIAARVAAQSAEAKRAQIDTALATELDRRKALADVYTKRTGADAVAAVFTVATAPKEIG